MKKTTLRKYARLIAQCGVNVQKGQEVFITAGLDQPDFVKMVAEECYKLGATRVVVDFDYQPLTKLHVKYCSLETLGGLTDYQKARFEHYVEKLPCRIYLESDDPDGLKGINQHKMLRAQQMRYPLIKGYRDEMENKYQWCIAAVPGWKTSTSGVLPRYRVPHGPRSFSRTPPSARLWRSFGTLFWPPAG